MSRVNWALGVSFVSSLICCVVCLSLYGPRVQRQEATDKALLKCQAVIDLQDLSLDTLRASDAMHAEGVMLKTEHVYYLEDKLEHVLEAHSSCKHRRRGRTPMRTATDIQAFIRATQQRDDLTRDSLFVVLDQIHVALEFVRQAEAEQHVTGRTCDGCGGRGKTMDYCDPDNEELVDCCECNGTGGWAITQKELDEEKF